MRAHLLLKEHGVDGLAAGQDHHWEPDGHGHHETHTDHFSHQVGGEVHQHVACNVFCEADVAKEPHLVYKGGQTMEKWLYGQNFKKLNFYVDD